MTNNNEVEISLGSVDKTIVGQINAELDNYNEGIKGSNKSVNVLAVIIHNSKMITKDDLKSYDNKMTQADITPFTNACIQQVLGIENIKTFNKNKRDCLNQAMIIACGTIKLNALFVNSKGESVHNGNILLKATASGVDKLKGTGDSTPYTKKDVLSWAKEQLKFVNKNGDKLSPLHKKGIAFFEGVGQSEHLTGLWSNYSKPTFKGVEFGSIVRTDLTRWFKQLQALIEQFDKQVAGQSNTTQTSKDRVNASIKKTFDTQLKRAIGR